MTQRERDRLVALKKANKRLITQRQAAAEMEVSERQVRRLLKRLKKLGDRAVIHCLRGKRSNRRMAEAVRERIVAILSEEVYRDFGPTLASEYLGKKHGIRIGREALRQLMTEARLWRPKSRKAGAIHMWRERKSRFGEMVQWDTSDHDWLEGRGEDLQLIHMIDDATSRLAARFVRHDSTRENMKMLRGWTERYGRALSFYTDKDSMFHTTPKRAEGVDAQSMPPTQIGRALQELQIAGILAHSPQAKGRVERSFLTAQDRLLKGMRVAGVRTLEEANRYLESEFLPWWQTHCEVRPACPDDAHRPLGKEHDLNAILSMVDKRRVDSGHTFRFDGQLYRIDHRDIVAGLRGAWIRTEQRMDGTMAIAFQGRYLRFEQCTPAEKAATAKATPTKPRSAAPRTSTWMKNFDLKKAPPIWTAK